MNVLSYCAIIISLLYFVSCQSKSEHKGRKIVGNNIIETHFIDDTTYHGITKYFSLSNVLEGEAEFINGIKNGYEKKYYPSGVVHDSMNFVYGRPNGFHFVYDSVGKLVYKDFFHQGFRVGGRYYYDKGKVSVYDFLNFEEQLLFKAEYDTIESVEKFGGEIINIHTSSKIVNDSTEYTLFLYLLNPPNVSVRYSIGIYDSISKKRTLYKAIQQSQDMLIEIKISLPNKSYYVQAEYIDSLNDFHQIYLQYFDL